jgi:hypothetical protein
MQTCTAVKVGNELFLGAFELFDEPLIGRVGDVFAVFPINPGAERDAGAGRGFGSGEAKPLADRLEPRGPVVAGCNLAFRHSLKHIAPAVRVPLPAPRRGPPPVYSPPRARD